MDLETKIKRASFKPTISVCRQTLTVSIVERGAVVYDLLTKPEADAILDAHNLLGWHLDYESVWPYLNQNYPILFPA